MVLVRAIETLVQRVANIEWVSESLLAVAISTGGVLDHFR
jgi:hypothetical protein